MPGIIRGGLPYLFTPQSAGNLLKCKNSVLTQQPAAGDPQQHKCLPVAKGIYCSSEVDE